MKPVSADSRTVVVVIHGLWMTGHEFGLLRRRVSRCGFTVRQFHYATVRKGYSENSQKLATFLQTIDADRVHFVCHSLGCLLLRHAVNNHHDARYGNTVMLGPPNQGSYVADQLCKRAWGRFILGHSVANGLDGRIPPWPDHLPLGVIAGNLAMGAGRIFPGLPLPNDGTVAVRETMLANTTSHKALPISHTGMLFSKAAIREICHFLHHRQFTPDQNP